MQYDFDTPIDRTHTWSIKHDFKKENGKADDILPLWVADMDFRSPDSVVEALKKAVDHGIFGYSRADESYFDAVAAWYQKRHHLTLQPEWMTCTRTSSFESFSSEDFTASTEPWTSALTIRFRFFISPA